MGLHQDKDESPESIAQGAPVVSFSIGDSGRFLFGGLRRREPVETILLESGDTFVFGGPARLRYHGVTRILPGTAPARIAVRRTPESDLPAVLIRLCSRRAPIGSTESRGRVRPQAGGFFWRPGRLNTKIDWSDLWQMPG